MGPGARGQARYRRAGLHKLKQLGTLPQVNSVVVTVTGHGLKDPDWALKDERGRAIKPKKVTATADAVAGILGLERVK